MFERYVREQGVLTVEQAVHKATGIPARIMRFEDRGMIKVGAKADLVLFDVVVVNGKVAREDGVLQSGRFGRVLRSGRR